MNYVRSKYEHTLFNKTCLFFPAKNPKRLVISFAYVSRGKPLYSAWSWFWQEDEQWVDTAYLFLYDQRGDFWYVNNSDTDKTEEQFIALITYVIQKLGISTEQVFTFGTSMGGYGALYYAITLDCKGAILFNPQIKKECAWPAGNPSGWGFSLQAEKNFKDIATLIRQTKKMPFVSLNIGSFGPDVCSATELMKVILEKKTFAILRKIDAGHDKPTRFKFNKERILQEIVWMESQPDIWY